MPKYIIKRIKNKLKRLLGIRGKVPHISKYIPKGNFEVVHISAFNYDNAGDTLLPVVLRDLFNQTIGVRKWIDKNVHKLVKNKDISTYNKNDFIVIGGGGLFLSDTAPNDISGWQWNCSIEMLERIDKPLIAFAIGYNRFRGQADFKPIFTEHLNAFVKKAAFVGIRNHGSIESLKKYLLTKELQDKLVFQPCMTTLIAKIYPDYTDYSQKEDFVVFNCAFDRKSNRSADDNYLRDIAKVALELSQITKIKYYSHMTSDKHALPYFNEVGVKYELVELKKVHQIVEGYARPKLVIGMRGHAQMIPFGCQTPILSIVSHDKLQWFLNDIGHPEWGVDVRSVDFAKMLLQKAKFMYEQSEKIQKEIVEAQNSLWNITLDNLNKINSLL